MSGHRHATDRTDWTYLLECPSDADHLSLEATAEHTAADPEGCFPIDECPECGAELASVKQSEPSEVLD